MNSIPVLKLDHLGIRVTNLQQALDFYSLFDFEVDSSENLDEHQACVLIHHSGLRINLVYNAANYQGHNVLIDAVIKYPGITHLALQVDNMLETQKHLAKNGITITEGPLKVSPRRIICFVRDPDGNVLEFNQLLREAG